MALGRPRLHLRVVDSTNTRARALAADGAPHGTLVTASEQTAGRGRQGRTWSAPPGRALLMSLVLRSPPPLLALVAGVAVCDAVTAVAPDARPQLKWPNDVLLVGRKLAGILVEGRPQEDWAVLGIGVNVAVRAEDLPVELRERAATLGLAPAEIETVLAGLLCALERWLVEPAGAQLDAWRSRDALRGREVAWSGGRGRAEGLDEGGRLLVAVGDEGERVALEAGEVHLAGDGA